MVVIMASFNRKATTWRHFCSPSWSMLEPPASREVHLWCLFPNEADEASLLQQYKAVLSCEERTHMLHVKNKKLQQEYLLTRVLARTLLARYTGGLIDPTSLKFVRSKSGKPQVLWPTCNEIGKIRCSPRLSFNLSHTHSLIACAITGAHQVGVDVEERNRVLSTDVITFARRRFSSKELSTLEQFPDLQQRSSHFLQLWTLKEAYLKALGKGISGTSLRDISFHFQPLSTNKFHEKLGIAVHEQCYFMELECQNSSQPYPGYCQLLLLQPTNAHFASICLQGLETVETGTKPMEDLRVQVMKTLPLVKDEPLFEASALGISDVFSWDATPCG